MTEAARSPPTAPISMRPIVELGTETTTSRRGRYVSQACGECSKRKVKCTGGQPCQPCQSIDAECVYVAQRLKKRKAAALSSEEAVRREIRPVEPPDDALLRLGDQLFSDSRVLENKIDDVINRLAKLEQNWILPGAHHQMGFAGTQASSSSSSEFGSLSSKAVDDRATLYPETQRCDPKETSFQGGTSLSRPIAILGRIATQNPESQHPVYTSGEKPFARCTFFDCVSSPDCCKADLQFWDPKTRPKDIQNVQAALKVYFDHINPHYPCLNEHFVTTRFWAYVNGEAKWAHIVDTLQFVALVTLIVALIKILEDHCIDSNTTPGWAEFSRASHLLSHTTQLGRGNLLTIQCYIVHAEYLLYCEKQNAAYDSITNAVRLCYQTGLHNQASWQTQSPFEVAMRQRTFWSLYCLERNIAFACGAPYLLHESDFRVELPPCYDDRCLFADQAPPPEAPSASSSPYIQAMAKWGRLCSEVWDSLFGRNAMKHVSPEFVATMDARIFLLRDELPEQLQWEMIKTGASQSVETESIPPFIYRQSFILYLRINHLRLLLRREDMLSLQFSRKTAEICLSVATQSVEAIHNRHVSGLRQQLERYSSVIYLSSAIIPLICIIFKVQDSEDLVKVKATENMKKALSILEDLATGLTIARHTLAQLQSLLGANRVADITGGTDQNDPSNQRLSAAPPDLDGMSFPLVATDHDSRVMVDDPLMMNLGDFTAASFTPAGDSDMFDARYWGARHLDSWQ